MAKIVDITDKLNFEEKPMIVIKKKKIKVNNDAKSIMELMAMVEDDEVSEVQVVQKGMALLFEDEERKKLDSMNLSVMNLMTVISSAMKLAADTGDDNQGEQ